MSSDLIVALAGVSSAHTETRRRAEMFLNTAATNLPQLVCELLRLGANPELECQLRTMALLVAHNKLRSHPSVIDIGAVRDLSLGALRSAFAESGHQDGAFVNQVAQVVGFVAKRLIPQRQFPMFDDISSLQLTDDTSHQRLRLIFIQTVMDDAVRGTELYDYLRGDRSSRILAMLIDLLQQPFHLRVSPYALGVLRSLIQNGVVEDPLCIKQVADALITCLENRSGGSHENTLLILQCFTQMASVLKRDIAGYMQVLFPLMGHILGTRNAADDAVVCECFELWTNIAEWERQEEEEEGAPQGDSIIRQAAPSLLPVLLEHLVREVDEIEEDGARELMRHQTAAICLEEIAKVVRHDIEDTVMSFVHQKVTESDPRSVDAGLTALGCMLYEGAETKVPQILPLVAQHSVSQSAAVRYSAMWLLCRVLQGSKGVSEFLDGQCDVTLFYKCILPRLSDTNSTVTQMACSALHQMCAVIQEQSEKDENGNEAEPNLLSPVFVLFTEKMMILTAWWPDDDDGPLRKTAMEALISLLRCARGEENLRFLKTLIPQFTKRSEALFAKTFNETVHENVMCIQGQICSCLSEIVKILRERVEAMDVECILGVLFAVMDSCPSGAQQDAILSIGHIAEALGDHFVRYADKCYPYVLHGLQSHDMELFKVACGATEDITKSSSSSHPGASSKLGFCDAAILSTLNVLADPCAPVDCKVLGLEMLGGLALNLGRDFQKYLSTVLPVALDAAQGDLSMEEENKSSVFEGICTLLSGVLLGCAKVDAAGYSPFIQITTQTVLALAKRAEDSFSSCIDALLGVIADLGDACGPQMDANIKRSLSVFVHKELKNINPKAKGHYLAKFALSNLK